MVAVIINHFNKDLLPSGYLGVDIFFVISGYVITSSLAEKESKNFLDFLTGFYERRIKRLVPALVGFAIVVNMLTWIFISSDGFNRIFATRTSVSSLLGLSNLYIYKQATDYFGTTAELNPFIHTWSLGVEEQFYLLFPFLIWFTGFAQQTAKGARNLFFWVGALTIASLIGFIYLYQVNQPAAYFLMPPRFWEMAAGCLLFIGFQKRGKIEQTLEKVSPLLVVAAMVGVMLLPVSAAVPATIGIVVLTAVLIACLKKGTTGYYLFTLEKVVYLGLISYSLYLWHWAIISLSLWTVGIHYWTIPLQVLAMLTAAVISYKWIEQPFRHSRYLWKRQTALLAAFFSIPTTGVVLILGDKFLREYQGGRSEENYFEFNKMLCGSNPLKIMFIGDSHSSQFVPKDVKGCAERGAILKYIGAGGTIYPLINYTNSTSGRTKSRNNLYNIEMASQMNKSSLPSKGEGFAAISIRSSLYFYDTKGVYKYDNAKHFNPKNGELISKQKAMSNWFRDLETFIGAHKETNIILLTPNPEFSSLYPSEVCVRQWFRPFLSSKCEDSTNREEEISRISTFVENLQTVGKHYSNVTIFDAFSVLCPPSAKRCSTHLNGKRLYSDDNHLNAAGARYVVERILAHLRDS